MSVRGKNVLVTGAAGFIGSHLIDALIEHGVNSAVAVDNLFLGERDNLEPALATGQAYFYEADARDIDALRNVIRRHEISIVYDLATIPLPASLEKPRWSSDAIWELAIAVCELAREGLIDTLVHCSSSEVYGSAVYVPMDENHPLKVETPYAAAKAAGDLIVRSYVQTFGINAVTVRPFNNYGPRQNDKSYAGVIPLTIKRLMRGEQPVIFGDGEQTRDYIYVTDTARSILRISERDDVAGREFNIASGKEVTIRALVQAVCDAFGYDGPWKWEPARVADVRRHLADSSDLEQLFGNEQRVSLAAGVRETVAWYRSERAVNAQ